MQNMKIVYINAKNLKIIILILLLCTYLAWANEISDENLTENESILIDSLITDSLEIALVKPDSIKIDSLFYAADSVFYYEEIERIDFIGNAAVKYHSSNIEADTISIDLTKNQAFAMGRSFLKDGTQTAIGKDIYFDLDSKWGIIQKGASKFDKGFYYGKEIRKIAKKAFDVDDGIFTTCGALHPHFYFSSKKFRLYQDDKIVGKPIVFYVNHFPIFAFPFGTFSIKKGRKPGILVPSPGYNNSYGKYIENIAYYFIYKNYFDATLAFDYYEKTGWEISFINRYIKRYVFNGNFTARLQRRIFGPDRSHYYWLLKETHHHDFGNKTTFDANLEFISSKKVWEGSENIDERLSEKVTSSLAFKKPFLSRTINMTAKYVDDLKNEKKDITLPYISYSLPSKPVYELFLSKEETDEEKWWKDFSYSYNFKAVHVGDINDPHAGFADVIYKNKKDSTGAYINQHNAGIKHSGGLRYSHKFKGWLNFSQSLSLNEAWFDRDEYDNKLVRGMDYNTNLSLFYSLYGIKQMPRFYLAAVRHIITPRISFRYNPDFSHNDKFYSFSGISLSSSQKQRKITFSIENKWQLKLAKTENKDERKINDFFKISSSCSYDLEKTGQRFSIINHSLNLNPKSFEYKILNFSFKPSGKISQDLYDFNIKNETPAKWNFPIENWSLTTTSKLGISGNAEYLDYFPEPENDFITQGFFQDDSLFAEEEEAINTLEELEKLSRDKKNWSLSFSHTYRTTKANYENHDYTSNLRTSLTAKLTKNWSVTYDNYINLKEKELVSHNITINRELHCWKIYFRFSKQGDYWNYQFRFFNIKLPDSLKFRTSDHKK
ncbi:MAG: LPS-assembly protein LptD [Armatimonadetes bacterium]|nr:LPS-assembly protein LptD [Armatimonadota bacterium]